MTVTTRNILYALAGMVGLFVIGALIGSVWDNNDTAGNITVTLWAISIIGAALLVLALALRQVRRSGASR
jgi:membrane protein DedA with SNARE-associated domain